MKKILATCAALLLLTACGAEKVPAEPTPVPETPVVEEPVEVTPEVVPEKTDELSFTTERLEGLVEDTVAYIYDYPQFGDPVMDSFYEELMTSLEEYARGKVYTAAIERHTIADVTGTYELTQTGETVIVTYTASVEFGDGETESFDRTDTYDLSVGKWIQE